MLLRFYWLTVLLTGVGSQRIGRRRNVNLAKQSTDFTSERVLNESVKITNDRISEKLKLNNQVQYMITMDRYVDVDRENNLCVNVNGGQGNYTVQLDIFTGKRFTKYQSEIPEIHKN